jgi:Tol biopolymer transport system component
VNFKHTNFAAIPLFATVFAAAAARADDTKLVTTLDGATTHGGDLVEMTPDGGLVLFVSRDPGYVAGDTNGGVDLFVKDMTTGAVERVNVANDGSQIDGDDIWLAESSISGDGRTVAFATIVPIDLADNPGVDVYLRDRVAGTTMLVSHGARIGGKFDNSFSPRVTRDGDHVVFASTLTSLVPGDTNRESDIFEWDRATDTFTRVSLDSSGRQLFNFPNVDPRVSSDGTVVAFTRVLLRGDVINGFFIYIKDLIGGGLDRIDDSSGNPVNDTDLIEVSPDGRFVLFNTAYALVTDDQNGTADGYVLDRVLGTKERVTLATGRQELHAYAWATGMSDDARRIAFVTDADASGDDENGVTDCFVVDRDTGATLRASLGPADEQAMSDCTGGTLSSDGHALLFSTASSTLWPGDGFGSDDVFVRTLSSVPAAWNNYGAGFPGRNGIPNLTLTDLPRRATTIGLTIGDSSGLYTVAVLFVGLQSESLLSSFGGTFLVDPVTSLALALTPWNDTQLITIPTAGDLPGLHVYLQALEIDPFAAKGVSFTPGLDLTIGD